MVDNLSKLSSFDFCVSDETVQTRKLIEIVTST